MRGRGGRGIVMMAAAGLTAQQQQLQRVHYQAQDIELLEVIGRGSFGVVQKAKIRGQIRAVKILQPQLLQLPNTKACERFQQECFLMNHIRHDNVVQCFGVIHLDQPVLIMELMDTNLRVYLEASPRRYYTQVDIVTDIVRAISYLHNVDVVHRDLSSANVLMKNNIAKVTDFGMARLLPTFNSPDLTKSPGTAVYMPPEARLNPPEYDQRVDIFSIGVLIIQILTRKFPEPVNVIKAPELRHCISEIERRASHIMESPDNSLRKIAICCLSDCKEGRPCADLLREELVKVKESLEYSEDRRIGEDGMQLAVQHNIPALFQRQSLMIEQQSQILSSLQLQLQHLGSVHEEQIQKLQSQVASGEQCIQELQTHLELQQHKMQEDHRLQLVNVKEQLQREMREKVEENNKVVHQQVHNYIQKMRSESDEEKQQLQQENEHKLLELEQSYSSLSAASSSFLQDSRSDSRLSYNEMTFKSASPAPPQAMHRWSSAVVHNNIMYLIPGRTKKIWKFDITSWIQVCDCEAENSTLAIVGDDLVAIGGQLYSGGDKSIIQYTSNLCTHCDGRWVKELPPMAVERDSVIATTNGKALIVVGGRGISPSKKPGFPLKAVEILSIELLQWQFACQLPFPLFHASITIYSDKLFILGGFETAHSENCSVLTCKLTDIILSRESAPTDVWGEVCMLPVSKSTCATYNHQLLAIGGLGADNKPSGAVYYYDEETDSWRHLTTLETPRIQCFSAMLSNQLFVIGGAAGKGKSLHSSVEVTL